jgi:hypothetical protein
MSAFVADAPTSVENDITNGAFFPSISPVKCRESVSLDGTITPERLRNALIAAMQNVNTDLAPYKQSQIDAGFATLNDVLADEIGGVSVKINLYIRAVYCFAKADLIERYRDYDSTLSGNQRADELEPAVDDYRRKGIIAIRAIIGTPRTTIELI